MFETAEGHGVTIESFISTKNSANSFQSSAISPDNWTWFKLGGSDGLFDIRKGKRLTSDDQTVGNTPYIGAIGSNNGISNSIGQEPIHKGNTISLSYNGSVGEAFYQPEPYWATDDVNALYLRPEHGVLSPLIGLFVCTVLRQEKYRFSYGRKWTLENMNATMIKLPATPEGTPDWQSMETFMRSLHHKSITTNNPSRSVQPIQIDEFVDFTFGNLVTEIYKAKAHTKDDITEVAPSELEVVQSIRYVTRTAENNGCELLAVRTNELESGIERGNAISIGDTTATCFYQGEDFIAGDHMVVVRADWLNPFTGNFITTLLNRESYRYSYGRAFIMSSIRETTVKLPIRLDEFGNRIIDPTKRYHKEGYVPDWQFMENYMRSLPYGDRIPVSDSDVDGVEGD